jgi:hypothetical protein
MSEFHDISVRRYSSLKSKDKDVHFRAECECGWNGPLRLGKMAKANAGRDLNNHIRETDQPVYLSVVEE